ncbi:MAG: DUF2169 domain-containing protein [Polyangiaceae bacterium]
MKIKNARLYPTAFLYGKAAPSEAFMAFVVKATFRMNTRRSVATDAKKQWPVLTTDVPYEKKAPKSLLRFESDLVAFKPRADIVLVGSAYAPRGQPAKSLDVEIRVGNTERVLRVVGDRMWSFPVRDQHAPICVGPNEFVEMPLTFDRAFGGIDAHASLDPTLPRFRPWCAQNYGGRGYIGALSVDSIHKTPLPNIEDPSDPIRTIASHPVPIGCGFFPRNNEPRFSYAGTFDERWKAERAPELPEDFRFEYYNGAHPHLQVDGYLTGSEAVTLTNVSKSRPRFEFLLPGIRPVLTVSRHPWPSDTESPNRSAPLAVEQVYPAFDTLVFIPDREIFFQVWRGIIKIRDPAALEVSEVRVDYESTAAQSASSWPAR